MTVAEAFGLKGEAWMRHANPASVWTRFASLPLLTLAIWSRTWIGWWALLPVAVSVVWIGVNPLFFRAPRSTRNWASKSVLGERISTESDPSTFPEQFRTRSATLAVTVQLIGVLIMGCGLVALNALATVAGLALVQLGKAWYLNRMVLLFDEMKVRDPAYAAWDY